MTSKPSLTNSPKLARVKEERVLEVRSLLKKREKRKLYRYVKVIMAVIASGFHLFPFRTEKLSPSAPMVLQTRGRVGRRQLLDERTCICNELRMQVLYFIMFCLLDLFQ